MANLTFFLLVPSSSLPEVAADGGETVSVLLSNLELSQMVLSSDESVVVVRAASDTGGASASGGVVCCMSQCWKIVLTRVEKTQVNLCLLLYSSNVSFECFRLLAGSHESSSGA